MAFTGERFEPLLSDLESALQELTKPFDHDTTLWGRGFPGRWTAGQHAEHIAISMRNFRAALEESLGRMRAGTLPPVPGRDPLQAFIVWLVARLGKIPRGGRTPPAFEASAAPEQAAVFRRLTAEAQALRALGAPLAPAERDRLWIANPFMTRWRYTLPETVRVHAVHARHHRDLIEEIANSPALARRP